MLNCSRMWRFGLGDSTLEDTKSEGLLGRGACSSDELQRGESLLAR